MASLRKTNPNLSDPERLSWMIARNAYQSSVFEGASPRSLSKAKELAYPRAKASSKKTTKAE